MIPITQVIDDIQETLLACTIELPVSGRPHSSNSSLLCAKVSRSHHSLTAFGLRSCPICEQDLSELTRAPEGGYLHHDTTSDHENLLVPDKPRVEKAAVLPADKASQISPPGDVDDDGSRASMILDEIPRHIRYIDESDFDGSTDWSSESEVVLSTHGSMNMRKPTPRQRGQFTTVNTPVRSFEGHQKAQASSYGQRQGHVELHIFLGRLEPWKQSWEDLNHTFPVVKSLFDIDNSANSDIRTTRITLHGASIKRALRSIISYYPSVQLKTKMPVQISEPYPILLHHMNELDDYMTLLRHHAMSGKHEDKQKMDRDGIESLWALTHSISCQTYFEAEKARHLRSVCTFRMLWLLYKPGTTVYHMDDDGDYSALVIGSVNVAESILRSSLDSVEPYTVYLWRLDFDGKVVGRSKQKCRIAPFEGEREIMKLKLCPCDLLDKSDNGRTRARLEERGRRWYKLLRGGAMQYHGPSVDNLGHVYVRKSLIHRKQNFWTPLLK